MKKYIKKTFETVNQILLTDEQSRNNDVRLCRLTYEKLGIPTNLYDLENLNVPSFETITRCRRKAQELNPFLKGKLDTKQLEEEFKEFSRL